MKGDNKNERFLVLIIRGIVITTINDFILVVSGLDENDTKPTMVISS